MLSKIADWARNPPAAVSEGGPGRRRNPVLGCVPGSAAARQPLALQAWHLPDRPFTRAAGVPGDMS